MTVKKIRGLIILFIIGFVFLSLDFYVSTEIDYPKSYEKNQDVIGEYQFYCINAFFGADCTYKVDEYMNVSDTGSDALATESDVIPIEFIDEVFFSPIRIDIFNDVVGCILLIILCTYLVKYSKAFAMTRILSYVTIILKLALTSLPFFLNGLILCNATLAVGFSYTLATIATTYCGTKGFLLIAKDTCCRDERIWINTCWISIMVITLLVLLLTWLNLTGLSTFFTTINIILILIIGFTLKRIEEFLARNCT